MLHAFLLFQSGIPVIYSGDEVGAFNDWRYKKNPLKREDSRYLHRGAFDWTLAEEMDDKNTIAALKYSYGGRDVGNVEIVATNATVEDLYYSKTNSETSEKESDVVAIRPVVLVAGSITVAVLLILIFGIKYIYDNYYFMRHNREVKKAERERFKTIKVKKRRRGWRRRH